MEAFHQIYENIPDSISIPDKYRNHRVEIIILPLGEKKANSGFDELFGSIPDFPEIHDVLDYEKRAELVSN